MSQEQHKRKHLRFADDFYNVITYFGVALSIVVLVCETILFWVDFLNPTHNDYLGIITYILLPPFLIIGLLLIPFGARWKAARVRKGLAESKPQAIHIDLSIPEHQNAFIIFVIGTVIVMLMTAIGSYKAYHYTESNRFCGVTCHGIMEPEFKAHSQSPHAKVMCVDCHIGSGAGSYVHYKMAGVRMLFETFKGDYQRPVPAPVTTLRPAKEICEECHWPGKSFSAIQMKKSYFADDPSKTPKWGISMLIQVGGKDKGGSGIHAHMYNNNDIYYVADDEKRQKITWVKSIGKKGEENIYVTKDSPYKDKAPDPAKIRRMDCMDCHNRPSHHYKAPDVLMNQALEDDLISPSIPMIKGKGVEVLAKEYKDKTEAFKNIETSLTHYYATKQTEYYSTHQVEVKKAIEAIKVMYENNFFPLMKARWDAYPDNVGHMISDGCFRCHDDEHKTKTGGNISRDCKICHIITQQGSGADIEKNVDGVEFKHPFEDDGSWQSMNCSQCHTGGG